MVRVMATGVFDIIHLGHLHYLEEARKLGDELYVVVATDSTVRKIKHEPITNESVRLKLIEALKPVDSALLGYEDDRYKIVEEIKPDIIALGYDQIHDEAEIKEELSKRGMNVEVVRLEKFDYDLDGTRKIIRKIIDWWTFKKKMEEIEGK
ncbi:MAG: FAD synthase [Thermoplasmata archaeon]|nr:MAG: FAD synthase [Thermoplasmata archaeon]